MDTLKAPIASNYRQAHRFCSILSSGDFDVEKTRQSLECVEKFVIRTRMFSERPPIYIAINEVVYRAEHLPSWPSLPIDVSGSFLSPIIRRSRRRQRPQKRCSKKTRGTLLRKCSLLKFHYIVTDRNCQEGTGQRCHPKKTAPRTRIGLDGQIVASYIHAW